jgi:acyl-coenzyme A thioesterase PaaI-like protein
LNINFVGHPKGQKLRTVAEFDRAGRHLYFASARVTDDYETLVATAEVVYAYVERQPQVQTASS